MEAIHMFWDGFMLFVCPSSHPSNTESLDARGADVSSNKAIGSLVHFKMVLLRSLEF